MTIPLAAISAQTGALAAPTLLLSSADRWIGRGGSQRVKRLTTAGLEAWIAHGAATVRSFDALASAAYHRQAAVPVVDLLLSDF